MMASTSIAETLISIIDGVPADSPMYDTVASGIITGMFDKYQQQGSIQMLKDAILIAKHVATQSVSDDGSSQLSWLKQVSELLEQLSLDASGSDAFGEAVAWKERAISKAAEITTADSDEQVSLLNDLSVMYQNWFDLTLQKEDIDAGLNAARRCKALAESLQSRHLPIILVNLGGLLNKRFDVFFELSDLDAAVETSREALALAQALGVDRSGLWMYLENLSSRLQIRHGWSHRLSDLDESIRLGEVLVEDDSVGGRQSLGRYCSELGSKLCSRYSRLDSCGRMENDFVRARTMTEHALALVPVGDVTRRAECLNHLFLLWVTRNEVVGASEGLEQALASLKATLPLIPISDVSVKARCMFNIANFLENKCLIHNDLEALESAIDLSREAIDQDPTADRVGFALRHLGLASRLHMRYQRMLRMEDLDDAVSLAQRAIEISPDRSSVGISAMNVLGNMLEDKFDRGRDIKNLQLASDELRRCVDLAPEGSPHLAAYHNNLGNKLGRLYLQKRDRDQEIMMEALREAERAVELVPEGHIDHPIYLHGLGIQLMLAHGAIGDDQIRVRAISVLEKAVQLSIGQNDTYETTFRISLGDAYSLDQADDKTTNARALDSYLEAFENAAGIPTQRAMAARRAVDIIAGSHDEESICLAADVSCRALDLILRVKFQLLGRTDQEHVLSHFSGLAADSCSLALRTNSNPAEALCLLERGRGRILDMLINDRADISAFEAKVPALTQEYENLRAVLSLPVPDSTDAAARITAFRYKANATAQIEICIEKIRMTPGLDGFMKLPDKDELVEQASDGVIVIVNVTNFGSDAILVSKAEGVRLLPLPQFRAHQVRKWIKRDLTNYERHEYGAKNKLYRQFLSWLWSNCVSEIIAKMPHRATQPEKEMETDSRQKIWWIGSGLASSLPFHAATDYRNSSSPENNLMSMATSSYVPTIKALQHARRPRESRRAENGLRVLFASMPSTPGLESLPGTEDEEAAMAAILPDAWHLETLKWPSASLITAKLPSCDIAQFSCHGETDMAFPSHSRLVLQRPPVPDDPTAEDALPPYPGLVQDSLTVLQVCDLNLEKAWIAFLSACSTAENNAQKLQDEVLHLGSGFLIAGFRHVIATMWPAHDGICIEVTKLFYGELTKQIDTRGELDADVTVALDAALLQVRQRYWRQPLAWAPFIHIGQ